MSKHKFLLSYITLSFIAFSLTCKPVRSQIVPDTTLGSENSIVKPDVIINNIPSNQIEGGAVRGNNLFHSFQKFNVNEGRGAYFLNPVGIDNIISRVTGGIPSSILGRLGVTGGSANLFLINPIGIIFGPNATLDVGGSFLASTADSFNFADGNQFSATNPKSVPLLTVSLPVGLGFNTSHLGAINVQGYGHNLFINDIAGSPIFSIGQSLTGLRMQPQKTVALVGGQVNFDGGTLKAPSGRIEVGSVTSGSVGLSLSPSGLFLNYEKVKDFQDIQIDKKALLDTSGFFNGDIFLQGRNVNITDASLVLTSNFGNYPLGKISINTTQTLNVDGIKTLTKPVGESNTLARGIVSQNFSLGKGADIVISAKNLSTQDFGGIVTATFGSGAGGNINIEVEDSTQIFSNNLPTTALTGSGIATYTSGSGSAGNLTLSTKQLSIKAGSIFASQTLSSGNSGNIILKAADTVKISGVVPIRFGNFTDSFFPSFLGALTTSSGNAGDVSINTKRLTLENGARLDSSTLASGSAGKVTINAIDSVEVSGSVPGLSVPTLIISSANVTNPFFNQLFRLYEPLDGDSGSITIKTDQLTVKDGAQITVRNDGITEGGTLQIDANSVILDRGSITASTAAGKGGDINLRTQNVQLRRGGAINATARGSSDGGNITIDTGIVAALENENSDITADAFAGRGGNIQISTQGIFGIDPRSQRTSKSDITASSDLGIDGVIDVRTLGFDASNVITPLQVSFIPPEQALAASCLARRNIEQGSFVVTGTGGLPTDPYSGVEVWDTLTEGVLGQTQTVPISQQLSNSNQENRPGKEAKLPLSEQQLNSNQETLVVLRPSKWKVGDPIVEAQGIVTTPDGGTLLETMLQQRRIQPPESLVCSGG